MVGRFLASLCALALVSCSGGGSMLRPATGTASGTNQSATATIRFVIPSGGATVARKPAFVSPAIQSASIAVSGMGQPIVANLTAQSPNCASGGGGLTCTISVGSPTGTVMFTVRTYDALNAQGNLLSTGSATTTVTLAGPNTINLALNGAVARLGMAILQPVVPVGTSASTQLVVQAFDAQNNIIIGAGSYVDASGNALTIIVTDPDTSGATHINGTLSVTVTAPANAALTLTSTGGLSGGSTVQFTASAAGLNSATALLGFGTPGETVYVADNWMSQINAYTPGQTGNIAPFRSILPTFSYPEMLAYDASGRVYVTDDDGVHNGNYQERINVYAANPTGNPAPVQQIVGPATGLGYTWGIAISAGGYIWVTNYQSGNQGILAFAPGANGNVAPVGKIQGATTTLGTPLAVAFDPSGNLWVTDGAAVKEFSATQVATVTSGGILNQAPVTVVSGAATGLNGSWNTALAFDASANMYVATGSTNTALIFVPGSNGNVAPARTLTGLGYPNGFGFDGSGNVFVSSNGSGAVNSAIMVFPAGTTGSTTPVRTIQTLGYPCFAGMGINAGRIDVLDQCALALYSFPVTASGPTAPTRTIQTYAGYPQGIWEDSAGNLYVTNNAVGGIAVFAAGASGYAQPTRFITGPATQLTGPVGVVTDSSGNLYAVNRNTSGTVPVIVVFGPGVTGNVAPIRTIGGSATTIQPALYGKPQIDPSGNLVLLNGSNAVPSSILFFGPSASGNVAPTHTISGNMTLLSNPSALFVDAVGNVYTVQAVGTTTTIFVFASGQYGNIAPTRTITSTAFLNAPYDMWVDGTGAIYLAQLYGNGAIAIFPPGASGSTTPVQITGNATQFYRPNGVAVGL